MCVHGSQQTASVVMRKPGADIAELSFELRQSYRAAVRKEQCVAKPAPKTHGTTRPARQ